MEAVFVVVMFLMSTVGFYGMFRQKRRADIGSLEDAENFTENDPRLQDVMPEQVVSEFQVQDPGTTVRRGFTPPNKPATPVTYGAPYSTQDDLSTNVAAATVAAYDAGHGCSTNSHHDAGGCHDAGPAFSSDGGSFGGD